MRGRFPWVTLLVAVAALLVFALKGLTELLQYDRSAIFGGELWRLFTGHLVHYSAAHIGFDLFAFALAGWGI